MPKTPRKLKAYLTYPNASVPKSTRYRWQQQEPVRQQHQSPIKEQHQQQHTYARIQEEESDYQLTFDTNEQMSLRIIIFLTSLVFISSTPNPSIPTKIKLIVKSKHHLLPQLTLLLLVKHLSQSMTQS